MSFWPVTTASLAGQRAVQIADAGFLGGDAEDGVLDDVNFRAGLCAGVCAVRSDGPTFRP